MKNNWEGSWEIMEWNIYCNVLPLLLQASTLFSWLFAPKADVYALHQLYYLSSGLWKVSANSNEQQEEIKMGLFIPPASSVPGLALTIAMFLYLRPQLLLTDSLRQDNTFLEKLIREVARSLNENWHHSLCSNTQCIAIQNIPTQVLIP